jgi:hypothetical protein
MEAVVSSMHFMNCVADNALKFLSDQESNPSSYGGENKEQEGLNPGVTILSFQSSRLNTVDHVFFK